MRIAWILLLGLSVASPATAQQPQDPLDRAIDLHLSGHLDEALAAYREIAPELLAEDPVGAAIARNNACAILLDRADYAAALEECRLARQLLEGADEPGLEAENLNNLGVVEQHLGDLESARGHLRAALDINRTLEDPEYQAINLGNLGALETAAGRYGDALAYHDAVTSLAESHAEDPWAAQQRAIARINRAVVLEKLGEYASALEEIRTILREGGLDPARTAILHGNAAVLLRNLGDPIRALEELDRAATALEGSPNPSIAANLAVNRGLALAEDLDRPADGESAFRAAVALAEEAGDRIELTQALIHLGLVRVGMGDLGGAERPLRRALVMAEEADLAEGRWSALHGLALRSLAAGDPASAVPLLEDAMDLVESVREGVGEQRMRASFFGDRRPVYATAVDAYRLLHEQDPSAGYDWKALLTAHRAKARDLLDSLGSPVQWSSGVRREDLVAALDGAGLVEYFLGRGRVFVWTLDERGLTLRTSGRGAEVRARAVEVHRDLSEGRAPGSAALAMLGETLLPETLPGDGEGPLYLAPDGPLFYVPFDLLPSAGDGRPLIEHATASLLPSGAYLSSASSARGQPPARPRLVGIAAGAARVPPAEAVALGGPLPSLPGARREVESAGELLASSTVLLSGDEATERNLEAAVGRPLTVLHVAAHAAMIERPEGSRSALVLASDAGGGDGLLWASEIAALPLECRLVVLSACSTALDPNGDGLGLSSLASAFLEAGSPAVVATLWRVDDQAAATMSQQLYWGLHTGLDSVRALADAKRALMRDDRWGAPALWAGWVHVGVPQLVARPSRRPYRLLLGVTFLLVLGIALWRTRGRRRSAGPGPPG